MNAVARLIYSSSRFDHITPILRQLHSLKLTNWSISNSQFSCSTGLCCHSSIAGWTWSICFSVLDVNSLGIVSSTHRHRILIFYVYMTLHVVRRTRLTDHFRLQATSCVRNDLPQHVIASLNLFKSSKIVSRLIYIFIFSMYILLCIMSAMCFFCHYQYSYRPIYYITIYTTNTINTIGYAACYV